MLHDHHGKLLDAGRRHFCARLCGCTAAGENCTKTDTTVKPYEERRLTIEWTSQL
jgi:hypothetical protein